MQRLTKVDNDILASSNQITGDLATAMLGTPEQQQRAKQDLQNYSDKITKELATALGCKPEDINKVSQGFAQAADQLQKDLEACARGESGAQEKLGQDLGKAADQLAGQTLRLMGFSSKDIQAARDDFAQQNQQMLSQLKPIAADEAKANKAIANAMRKFANDLEHHRSPLKLNADAANVATNIRNALNPMMPEKEEAKSAMGWLIGGAILIGGGIYWYRSNSTKVDSKLNEAERQAKHLARDTANRANSIGNDVEEKAKQAADYAKDKTHEAAAYAKDKGQEAKDAAKKMIGK